MPKTRPHNKKPARAGGVASPISVRPVATNKIVAQLKAANKRLRASLREAEKERDAYRQAIYARIEERVAREDLAPLMDLQNAVPLGDVVQELEQERKR